MSGLFICAWSILHHDPTFLSDEYRQHPYSIFHGIKKITSVVYDDVKFDLDEVRDVIHQNISSGRAYSDILILRHYETMEHFWRLYDFYDPFLRRPSATTSPLPSIVLHYPDGSTRYLKTMDRFDVHHHDTIVPQTPVKQVKRLQMELEETKDRVKIKREWKWDSRQRTCQDAQR